MKNEIKYSLGLDIGTASVGWAVIDLEKERIHDLGVRIFERPEDPQNGDSLAKPRREARSARRRLRRRRQRLNNLKNFFVEQDLLTREKVEEVLSPDSKYNKLDVYELREKALNEELSAEELLKVLYQIAKRRGFKSNRKVVEEESKSSEDGRVSQAVKANRNLAENYGTVGKALNLDDKFKLRKRNSRDSYTNSFQREDFKKELEAIIESQKKYALKNIDEKEIDKLIFGVVDDEVVNKSAVLYQRPFMTKELIESMIGQCTFEKDEKRAPRSSYSFEIFRLASDLAHVRFVPKDAGRDRSGEIKLSPEQIQAVIEKAKTQKTLKYAAMKKAAGIGDEYRVVSPRGKITEDDPFGEKNDFGGLPAYHSIKDVFKDSPEIWREIDNEEVLNKIAYILTTEKADNEIKAELEKIDLPAGAVERLLKVNPKYFKTFGHLSIKALQKITPNILKGASYSDACEKAGYDFKKSESSLESITNPVVKRAVSQTNKVVQAIIRKYGEPYFIRIETARDLAKSFSDRKDIERENKENQAANQNIVATLEEHGVSSPNGQQIIKVKLYREQGGKCLYSGEKIDFEEMLRDDNAYQVDHIVPFSRTPNDGMTNKVLVKTEENQLKADRTPYEYFGSDEERWQRFVALVEATYKTRDVKTKDRQANRNNYKYNGYAFKKKSNLLITEYKNDGWNIRALNDTKYITRFMQNYLRNNVKFADGPEKQRVFAPTGAITGYLRKRWGLGKDRDESVLHHAQDAAVVATIDQKVIYRANLQARKGEKKRLLQAVRTMEEKTNLITGEITDDEKFTEAQRTKMEMEAINSKLFPQPWEGFSKEVRVRTSQFSVEDLQNELRGLENYDDEFRLQVKPIFVSRMPRRKARGRAHKDTIRSPKTKDGSLRTARMDLKKVKKKDLENSVLKKSDKWLYDRLMSLLEKHDDNPEKAFAEPVYKNDKKYDKNGKEIAPVSTIKVYSKHPATSGYLINDGKAYVNNGSMVRLDVYKKKNQKGKIEHFFVPVYAHQVGRNRPEPTKILPAPKGFTDVDDTFDKVCTLFPNDYVRVILKNEVREGYYVQYDIVNGAARLLPNVSARKDNLTQVYPKNSKKIQRLDISILGDNYPWS